MPVASGNAQAVSILSPEEAASLGGLPGPAVAGFLGGDPPSFEAFRPNRALVAGSYVPNPQHRVLSRVGLVQLPPFIRRDLVTELARVQDAEVGGPPSA